jgi:CheY-like chemotaxis protein
MVHPWAADFQKGTDFVAPGSSLADQQRRSMPSEVTGLVVEDEGLLRLELVEELAAAGWRMREAASGEEALRALARFQEQDERIDFLVTDIRLGGAVDGWQVAEAYAAAWPGLPVTYVSANPIAEHRKVPGSFFLSKPVDVEGLVMMYRKLLADRG